MSEYSWDLKQDNCLKNSRILNEWKSLLWLSIYSMGNLINYCAVIFSDFINCVLFRTRILFKLQINIYFSPHFQWSNPIIALFMHNDISWRTIAKVIDRKWRLFWDSTYKHIQNFPKRPRKTFESYHMHLTCVVIPILFFFIEKNFSAYERNNYRLITTNGKRYMFKIF